MPDSSDAGGSGLGLSEAGAWRTLDDFPPVTTGAIWNGNAIVGYRMPFAALERRDPMTDASTPHPIAAETGVFQYAP
jgi:hypothetical protein